MELCWQRNTELLEGRGHFLVALCPPKIPHGLAWVRTWKIMEKVYRVLCSEEVRFVCRRYSGWRCHAVQETPTVCHMCPSCSHTLRIVASDRRRRISLVFWYSQSLLQQPEIMWGSFISGRISCFGAACAVCLLVTSRHKVTLAHNTKITFTYNTVVSD